MPRIIIEGYRCQRCNHHWAPRNGTGYRDKDDPRDLPKMQEHPTGTNPGYSKRGFRVA